MEILSSNEDKKEEGDTNLALSLGKMSLDRKQGAIWMGRDPLLTLV